MPRRNEERNGEKGEGDKKIKWRKRRRNQEEEVQACVNFGQIEKEEFLHKSYLKTRLIFMATLETLQRSSSDEFMEMYSIVRWTAKFT